MAQVEVQLPEYAGPFLLPARFKSLDGGRDSAKSHSAAQIMLLRMAGMLPAYRPAPVRIVSCRDFNTNLKHSVKVAVDNYAAKLFTRGEFECLATEVRYHGTRSDPASGSVMTFHGVTNQEDSFLSMEDIDVFWMEQAEMLQDEMVKIEPTIRKPGSELLFIWNPAGRLSYCWQRFKKNPQPGDVIAHVTYRDNPWLSAESERTRRYYEEHEPLLYPWVYEGEPYDGDGSHKVLPYSTVERCVKAWKAGLAPPEEERQRFCYAGLDLADGGANKCALAIRAGPVIERLDRWPGVTGDLRPAAQRAHRNIRESGLPVVRVHFDGATSGMHAELMRVQKDAGDGPIYGVKAVGFGDAVNGPEVLYETGRPNKHVFARLNIQMADSLRLRANRTVRLMNGDKTVRPMDCLFIRDDLCDLEGRPVLDTFLEELSRPLRRVSPQTGKWELDKTGGGEESPDTFDGACLSFLRDTLKLRAR